MKTISITLSKTEFDQVLSILKREEVRLNTICILDGEPPSSTVSKQLKKLRGILDKVDDR